MPLLASMTYRNLLLDHEVSHLFCTIFSPLDLPSFVPERRAFVCTHCSLPKVIKNNVYALGASSEVPVPVPDVAIVDKLVD